MSSPRPNSFDLHGRLAVVTGGAGWLGRPMVEALAEAGARVIIASRDAANAAGVVRACTDQGLSVEYLPYDQADEASIDALADRTAEMPGGVDILVNNAAQWPMRSRQAPLADFARSMQVNATGLFAITRRFGDHMAARGHGVIVNVGSVFGLVGPDFSLYEDIGDGGFPDYFFHKGGLLQLTRYAAALYGPRGVRVNTLSLGPFRKRQPDELAARFAGRTLLGRMGAAPEVRGAIVFLASAASSYMTGSNLVVDGGYTAI
ncbi:MAG: SDR family oxidoreductase [Opitutus sp.]|nr:SDR family oxidoreductase [Opitutus sp.]